MVDHHIVAVICCAATVEFSQLIQRAGCRGGWFLGAQALQPQLLLPMVVVCQFLLACQCRALLASPREGVRLLDIWHMISLTAAHAAKY